MGLTGCAPTREMTAATVTCFRKVTFLTAIRKEIRKKSRKMALLLKKELRRNVSFCLVKDSFR